MKPSAITTRTGFSLIEMLVVVAIISIVLAITFPMIGAMRRDAGASSGINTVSVAIPSIRRYAVRDKEFVTDLDLSTADTEMGVYSGAAAIFTPAGEVRLTENTAFQTSTDFPARPFLLEQHGPRLFDTQAVNAPPKRELNGFTDLSVDYLLLPSDTGVAGINRVSGLNGNMANADSGEYPLLLPPPFAVWYNQNGYLVATGWDMVTGRRNDYQFVYYDGNYKHGIALTGNGSFRGEVTNYNPDEYNPNAGEFDPNNFDPDAGTSGKYILPFEALEAVVGIYVYSRDAFQEANQRWDNGETDPKVAAPPWTEMTRNDNEARWQWMVENGEMILFSKQTGALIRNRNE